MPGNCMFFCGCGGPGDFCAAIVTCTGGTPPAGTIVLTDDLGNTITPNTTSSTKNCYTTVRGRTYTVCATITGGGGPWLAPPCHTFAGPAIGTYDLFTSQAPNVIRLTSSSQTCNGGLYRDDILTFASTCPFPVKPNGHDQPGYYGSSTFTITWVKNLGPYSPCGPFAGGSTVYDGIDGLTFYYFIPATSPGVSPGGGFPLFQVPTNGAFPGLTGGAIAYNPCFFPYVETQMGTCPGFHGLRFDMAGQFPCTLDDVILCNCFLNPGMCLEVANPIPACHPNGLPAGSFSLTWEIVS